MIGKVLNHYKIIEPLGRGGMGEVYLAEDSRLDRKVALKILPADLARDPERRMRFEREAKAVAQLNHPNIVTIYSVEEAEGLHFFTMELVDGKPLADLIPEIGLAIPALCDLSLQLVEALAAAHKSGVTHRDLKPANVMVTSEDRVKVLDFGLAKLREEPTSDDSETMVAEDHLTQVGRVVGTIAYMSPEQAEGRPVNERSDVFSLGILLYQMATGKMPFAGETQLSLMSSILKDQPTSASDLNPALPATLNAIIHRCLEKEPSHRYATAQDLLSELASFRQDLQADELMASRTGISGVFKALGGGGKSRSPRARRMALAAAAAFITVIVLVALLLPGLLDREGSIPTSEEGRRSLAVFYFNNMTGEPGLDWLRTGLTDMLITDLSQTPDLRVLGTDRLHDILERTGGLDKPQVSFDVVQAVARSAGVGTAVLGSFMKVGNTLRINVRIQNTDNGEIVDSAKADGAGEAEILSMVDSLTRSIKQKFEETSAPADPEDRDLASVTTDSVEAYKSYVQGLELHENGDDQGAVAFLEKAIELDPGFAMALAKLSVAYGNTGDEAREKEHARKAFELVEHLSARERYYIEGRHYSLAEDTREKAVEAYRRAIELFPDHDAARNNLALIYRDQGNFDEAILHLEELRSRNMSFPGTYQTLAGAYISLQQPDKAEEVLRDYTVRYPDNAGGHTNLGQLLLQTGKPEQAIQFFRKSNGLAPGSADDKLMMALIVTERWDEAVVAARRLQQSEAPFSRWVGFAIEGIQDLYFGRAEESFEMIGRAGAQFPEGHPMALRVDTIRASFLIRAGFPRRALEIARRGLEGLEDAGLRRGFLSSAAIASEILGDQDGSREYRDEFIQSLEPGDQDWQRRASSILTGHLALLQNRYDDAIQSLEAADALLNRFNSDPSTDSADVWSGLAMAHWKKGDKDESAKWLRRLLNGGDARIISPIEYVRSLEYLGRYHEERGDEEEALRYYRKYLEFWGDGELDRERVAEVRAKVEMR